MSELRRESDISRHNLNPVVKRAERNLWTSALRAGHVAWRTEDLWRNSILRG